MKKTFIVILLFSFQLGFAQSGWFWQSPLPSGSNLNCAAYLDANTILAASDEGTFLKSTNSGLTWKSEKVLPSSIDFAYKSKAIKAFDRNKINILIIKKNPVTNKYIHQLLKTINGGVDWTAYTIDTLDYINMNKIQFVNENTGYAYTNYRQYTGVTKSLVYKTTNAGVNWSKFSIGTNDSLSNVCFINENTGWVSGGYFSYKFYKTTNAGASWQIYYTTEVFNLPCFVNENTGYIFKYYSGSKTTNGGINFTPMSGIAQWEEEITDAGFINENTGWAMTAVSIYMTSNGGQNWLKTYSAPIPMQSNFYSIINNGNKACVVGNVGLISTSTNYGFNWTQQFSNSFPDATHLNDVFFVNANTGWIQTQGYPSRTYKTVDGGNSWTPMENVWSRMRFINQNTGIALKGNFARTSDGGASWQNYSYSGFTFTKVNFTSQNVFYIMGNDNTNRNSMILKSTNSGINWIETGLAPQRILNDMHFLNETTGFIYTDSSGIFRTTDGSASWQYAGSVIKPFSARSIYFTDVNTGYAGSYNEIYKTTNGGASWQQKFSSGTGILFSMQFVNNLTGWTGGFNDAGGIIYKTTDGGNSWASDLPFSMSGFILSIYFLNESTGWVIGNNGVLIKTTTGGTIGIQQISASLPDKFYLEQNYPNPFNPNTNIKFSLPKNSFVKLKVFDLLGREIANLVNENLSAGSYKYDFNASLLPSGIYFYKLETENFSETKKMVLVK